MKYMHDDLEPRAFPINHNDKFYGLIGTLYFILKPWSKRAHKIWDLMDKPKPMKTVARKNAPLVDKSCSSSLNGSDLEQMSYNRVGRLPLEVVEIWNESFWCSDVVVSYGDGSSHMHLHDHMKQANKIKKHQNMIHYYMLVAKESNNKIHDDNTT